ncbi:Uncharacterised protein [Mycobacterium tuberculosis]|nr:Uncharacterised protein [Mycobacterium tuberculosis]
MKGADLLPMMAACERFSSTTMTTCAKVGRALAARPTCGTAPTHEASNDAARTPITAKARYTLVRGRLRAWIPRSMPGVYGRG